MPFSGLRQNKGAQIVATAQLHCLLDILKQVIDIAGRPGVVTLVRWNFQGLTGEELLDGLGSQNPFPYGGGSAECWYPGYIHLAEYLNRVSHGSPPWQNVPKLRDSQLRGRPG
ncbi:hypothetical protein D3C81_1603380 [compost metagenome]